MAITSASKIQKHKSQKIAGVSNTVTPFGVGNDWGKHFPQTWKKPCLKLAKACLSTKFSSVFEKIIQPTEY